MDVDAATEEDEADAVVDLDEHLEDESVHDLVAETVGLAEEADSGSDPDGASPAEGDEPEAVRLGSSGSDAVRRPRPAPSEPSVPRPTEVEPEPDLTDAIDLDAGGTFEDRDRLLAQALAHAEMQDARYRVPYADRRRAKPWKGVTAIAVLFVAALVAVAPPSWIRPEPPARLSAAARLRGVRLALLLQADRVDAYRVRNQRLPDSLDEMPGSPAGIRYVRSGSRAYQLVVYEPDGSAITYDSAHPAPEFAALASSRAARREGS